MLLVPEGERESVVGAVETRVSTTFRDAASGVESGRGTVTLRSAPVQGDGFVEETERVFERLPESGGAPTGKGKRPRGAGKGESRGEDRGAA